MRIKKIQQDLNKLIFFWITTANEKISKRKLYALRCAKRHTHTYSSTHKIYRVYRLLSFVECCVEVVIRKSNMKAFRCCNLWKFISFITDADAAAAADAAVVLCYIVVIVICLIWNENKTNNFEQIQNHVRKLVFTCFPFNFFFVWKQKWQKTDINQEFDVLNISYVLP